MMFSLLRPSSWIKNLLVFAPIIFSFNLTNLELLINEALAFIGFCITASAMYIVNDLIDRNKDKLHPRKKHRPIASGAVKSKQAVLIAIILLILAAVISIQLNPNYLISLVIYLFVNLAYSLFLKRINLIEIFTVAIFFILRILAGCAAIEVLPSQWIIMVTFFIALFLTAIKRKSEIIILRENAFSHRSVLKHYTVDMLNVIIYITGTITILGYVLYTMDSRTIDIFSNSGLIYSSFFVALGLFRFIQLSSNGSYESEGDPTQLIFKDRFLQITIILWSVSVVLILYVL